MPILIRKPAPFDQFDNIKEKDAIPSESYDQQHGSTEGCSLNNADTIGAEQKAKIFSEQHGHRDLPDNKQEHHHRPEAPFTSV